MENLNQWSVQDARLEQERIVFAEQQGVLDIIYAQIRIQLTEQHIVINLSKRGTE